MSRAIDTTQRLNVPVGAAAPADDLVDRLEQLNAIGALLSAERARPGQVVVGFAAETDDVLAHGREKLARKGCDLLVVNEVGEDRGFESGENAAVVLGRDGSQTVVPLGPKEALADCVWDLVLARLPR